MRVLSDGSVEDAHKDRPQTLMESAFAGEGAGNTNGAAQCHHWSMFWINKHGEWSATADCAAELPGLRIRHAEVAGAEVCVLLADENVRVNGSAVRHGIRVLRDRDEIAAGTVRLFFSTERIATVEPFAGESVACGRCCSAIAEGDDSVRCPACGTVSHQFAELPCFTYGPTCPKCPQPSHLGAGLLWTPEEVGA